MIAATAISTTALAAGGLLTWAPLGLGWAIKATLVLAIALLVMSLCRRRSAALCHAIGIAALITLWILPLLVGRLPVSLPATAWLEPWTLQTVDRPATDSASVSPPPADQRASEERDVPFDRLPGAPDSPIEFPAEGTARLLPADSNASPTSTAAAINVPAGSDLSDRRPHEFTANRRAVVVSGVVIAILGAGSVLLLIRLVASAVWLSGTIRQATAWPSGPWSDRADRARRELNLRQSVRIRVTPGAHMPLACGILRPCVLIPQDALRGDPETLHAVLLHELAHVQRRDPLWQWIVEVTGILFWFHPLYWWLRLRCAAHREAACDDVVINRGVSADEYARCLIRFASGRVARPMLTAGVAMSARSRIQGRLRALFDDRRNRRSVSYRSLSMIIVAYLFLACGLAGGPTNGQTNPADGTVTAEETGSREGDRSTPQDQPDGTSTQPSQAEDVEEADGPADDSHEIIWDKERNGWQVGGRLIRSSRRLQVGDPIVVQFYLKNVTDDEQTIVLHQYDRTTPVLGGNNRINLNLGGDHNRRHQHVLQAGEVLNARQYRVTVSTEGLLPGDYTVSAQPAFWKPGDHGPNSGTGIGRSFAIPFALVDDSPIEYRTPPEGMGVERIYWGEPVAGLVVGMRLPEGRQVWTTDTRIEGELFVRNITNRPIEFTYQIQPLAEWNMNVETHDGQYVRLDWTWFSGAIPRVTRKLTLAPEEQAPLTGIEAEIQVGGLEPDRAETRRIDGPTLQLLSEKTEFNYGDPRRLIAKSGSYRWSAWVTVNQDHVPDVSMVIGSSPVPFDIGVE